MRMMEGRKGELVKIDGILQIEKCLLEQSCDDAHFFLSSAFSPEFCCLRIERPQPAVIVPKRENARFTIGDDGTLFGLGVSISGTWRKFELFGR